MSKSDSRDSKHGRPNTLDASDCHLVRILDEINCSQSPASSGSREFSRIGLRLPSTEITIEHPGGNKSTLRLACRNLSRGGIALLHNSFVYTGSMCTITLERVDGTRVCIGGRIVRCVHRTGIVHELGIQFDQEIDPRQFVRFDPFSTSTTFERVDPQSLRGVLLYATKSDMDQKIVRHCLRDSNVVLRTVCSGSEAVEHARSGVDVVMTDLDLPDMDAAELRVGLRASGSFTPLIVATGLTDRGTRARVLAAEPDLVIVKPFKSGILSRLLAEFMQPNDLQRAPSDGAGAVPSLFTERARDFADRLNALRGEGNRLELYALCAELGSEAMQVGAVRISTQADSIAQRIGNGAELEFLGQELGDLIRLCQSIKHAA